jgi:hypothetical protein
VLRGFLPGAEEVTMAALDIAKPGKVNLLFAKPLKIEGSFVRCTAEPWLVWGGEAPLVLSEIPTIIS